MYLVTEQGKKLAHIAKEYGTHGYDTFPCKENLEEG